MYGTVVAQTDRHVDGVIFHVATLEDADWLCNLQGGEKYALLKFLFSYESSINAVYIQRSTLK